VVGESSWRGGGQDFDVLYVFTVESGWENRGKEVSEMSEQEEDHRTREDDKRESAQGREGDTPS